MSAHGQIEQRGMSFVTMSNRERELSLLGMGMSPSMGKVPVGRFGRIFEGLPTYDPTNEALRKIAERMKETPDTTDPDSDIPLGFAFLGQFIDHDITLEPTSRLDDRLDPHAVRNFRTPALDLDSIYGEGPDVSRHLYDTKGTNMASEHRLPFRLLTDTAVNEYDLPRNRQGTAIIGDPRNDENLLISQLHRAMLGFHNEVVKYLEKNSNGNPPANKDLFEEARKLVTLHYHWIIKNEFLPLVAGEAVTNDVLINGRRFFKWEEKAERPFIPIEFSGAAYRFGHTLIRKSYNLNGRTERGNIELFKLPFFGLCPKVDASGHEPCSGGGYDPSYNLDWSYFFAFSDTSNLQFCRKIDAKIASPLFDLPFIHQAQDAPKSLPERNLRRARTLKVPSGQDIAMVMEEAPLSNSDLGIDDIDGTGGKAPLWFYILKESELAGGKTLGKVGARIVAEVIIALMDVVQKTYLSETERLSWKPTLPPPTTGNIGTFTMVDLVSFRVN